MTENEAKDILEEVKIEVKTLEDSMYEHTTYYLNALDIAIKALEEIQQYRAIGTVEEIEQISRDLKRQMAHSDKLSEVLKSTKNLLKKREDMLKKYCEIGTVEECREARGRQKEMKTGEPYINGYGNKKAECLNCHCTVMHPANYCKFCGQRLDWAE